MKKLTKTPAPTRIEKKAWLAVLDHSRGEAARFLNMLCELSIQSHGILSELSLDSMAEKDGIAARLKKLEMDEQQYTYSLDKFNASSAQIIEQIQGEVNRSESIMSPPAPPVAAGPK